MTHFLLRGGQDSLSVIEVDMIHFLLRGGHKSLPVEDVDMIQLPGNMRIGLPYLTYSHV